MVDDSICYKINTCLFSFYNDETAKKISVKHIFNPLALDFLYHPLENGLYDSAMGVSYNDPHSKCESCQLSEVNCPGHLGHIELIAPVYNPFLMPLLYKLLNATCLNCHKLKIRKEKQKYFLAKLKLLTKGMLIESEEINSIAFTHSKNLIKESEEGDDSEESNHKKDSESKNLNLIYAKLIEKSRLNHKKDTEKKLKKSERKLIGFKDSSSLKEEEKIEQEFWDSSKNKKCENCLNMNPRIKRDGFIKFFKTPISSKDLALNKKTQMRDEDSDNKQNQINLSGSDNTQEKNVKNEKNAKNAKNENNINNAKKSLAQQTENQIYLHPFELLNHLKLVFKNNYKFLSYLFGNMRYNLTSEDIAERFFIKSILIPANRFRPQNKGNEDEELLHSHTILLTKIINVNNFIKEAGIISNDNANANIITSSELIKKLIELQDSVNIFLDSAKASKKSNVESKGIRQLIEKKEGIFRRKMMGKRVNYAARSVISSDPYIDTNEIGIPLFMAQRLTFPEAMNRYNKDKLRKLIINGANNYPGANIVEDEEGTRFLLNHMDENKRKALAERVTAQTELKCTVYRHLVSGDALLVNRQPTLHRVGIMGHYARVLQTEQTIRMHYSNCSSYNADFDGDEMNVHFVQNEMARAEAFHIMLTDNNYTVPTSGKPIRGLIQDSIISGVYLTSKDQFFDAKTYNLLLFVSLRNALDKKFIPKIELVPPTIMKPVQLWTGKQVISSIIKSYEKSAQANLKIPNHKQTGITFKSKTKLPASVWGKCGIEEGIANFRNGYLLHGILDKSQFGASEFGLIHSLYELYGPRYAAEMLNSLGKLFPVFIQLNGFTCGMDDLTLSNSYEKKRTEILNEGIRKAQDALVKTISKSSDLTVKQIRDITEEKVLTDKLIEEEIEKNVKTEVYAAMSKVGNECMPIGLSKRFPQNCMSCMVLSGAKGSDVNHFQISYLLGQQELEGKRVQKMPSGKILPCFEAYDNNPVAAGFITDRFLTGLKPQMFFYHCMAGREGLIDTAIKTSRAGYMQRCLIKSLESLVVQYDSTVRDCDGSIIQFLYGEDSIDPMKSKFLDQLDFMNANSGVIKKKLCHTEMIKYLNKKAVKNKRKSLGKNDTIMNNFPPTKYLGSVSERMYSKVQEFINSNGNEIENLSYLKFLSSIIQPGECVGVTASQSIGEPSTQMTLNTFHLAGHGKINVTLGIPRLREILMTASSKIKTPTMTLPLKLKANDNKTIKFVENYFSKVMLKDLLNNISVEQSIVRKEENNYRLYKILLGFKSNDEVNEIYGIDLQKEMKRLKENFGKKLDILIKKSLKSSTKNIIFKAKPFNEKNEKKRKKRKRKYKRR